MKIGIGSPRIVPDTRPQERGSLVRLGRPGPFQLHIGLRSERYENLRLYLRNLHSKLSTQLRKDRQQPTLGNLYRIRQVAYVHYIAVDVEHELIERILNLRNRPKDYQGVGNLLIVPELDGSAGKPLIRQVRVVIPVDLCDRDLVRRILDRELDHVEHCRIQSEHPSPEDSRFRDTLDIRP